MNKIQSKDNCLNHYTWGAGCDGWDFVRLPNAAVKQERMPAGTSEQLHWHAYATQFFFILKGTAVFLVDDERIAVQPFQGLTIAAGSRHKISNEDLEDLEFLLCSFPSTQNDRIDCE